MPDSSILYETEPAALIAGVRDGRADALGYPLLPARALLSYYDVEPDRFQVVRLLGECDMYFAFNRNVSPIVVRASNQSLAALKMERDTAGVAPYERILYRHVGVECSTGTANLTGAMAVVNLTADRMATDAPGAFQGINAGRAPYRDPVDPEVYAFVYGTNLTMVAHGSNYRLVGQNFRGRTETGGTAFRDEILAMATAKGSGRVDYVYANIDESSLSRKTTYCRSVGGSDGRGFIICAGTFRDCDSWGMLPIPDAGSPSTCDACPGGTAATRGSTGPTATRVQRTTPKTARMTRSTGQKPWDRNPAGRATAPRNSKGRPTPRPGRIRPASAAQPWCRRRPAWRWTWQTRQAPGGTRISNRAPIPGRPFSAIVMPVVARISLDR